MNKTLLSKWGLGLSSVVAFAGFIGAVNQLDQNKSEGQSQPGLPESPFIEQSQPSVDAVKEEWITSSSNSNGDIIPFQVESREVEEKYEHEYGEEREHEHGHRHDDDDDDDDDEIGEYSKFNPSVSAPSYTESQQRVQLVRRTRAS